MFFKAVPEARDTKSISLMATLLDEHGLWLPAKIWVSGHIKNKALCRSIASKTLDWNRETESRTYIE